MWSIRKPEVEVPEFYFECRLLPDQREALLAFLDGEKMKVSILKEIIVRVKAAKRYDLDAVEVDWEKPEREADARGGTFADWVGDAPWELRD